MPSLLRQNRRLCRSYTHTSSGFKVMLQSECQTREGQATSLILVDLTGKTKSIKVISGLEEKRCIIYYPFIITTILVWMEFCGWKKVVFWNMPFSTFPIMVLSEEHAVIAIFTWWQQRFKNRYKCASCIYCLFLLGSHMQNPTGGSGTDEWNKKII